MPGAAALTAASTSVKKFSINLRSDNCGGRKTRESDSPQTISQRSWQCAWDHCPDGTTNEVACSPQYMAAWPHSTGSGPWCFGSGEGDLLLLKESRPSPSASHHLPWLFHTIKQKKLLNSSLYMYIQWWPKVCCIECYTCIWVKCFSLHLILIGW